MFIFRLVKSSVIGIATVALVACGGGSSSSNATPTGGALPNLWFADSSGYHPLDKLKADGTVFKATDTDFGLVNPAFASDNGRQSRWAIDASASVDAGASLTYTMAVGSVSASPASVAALSSNLQFDANTGYITQYCSGFPSCYDNTSGTEEDFLITVTANVVGGKGTLQRNFILRVR